MASTIGKINQTAIANIGKVNNVAFANYKKKNGIYTALTDIPVGLIIPYTAGAGGAPANWSLWATADGNYIVGAGSTYAVAATGSTGTFPVALATDAAMNHTGAGDITNVATNGGRYRNSSSTGAHAHTQTVTWTPPYQDIYLIKAGATPGNEFPAGSVLFSYDADKSAIATNIYTNGYMFKANAGVTTGGSDAPSPASNSAGAHRHGNADSGDGSGTECEISIAGHTHSPVVTMTNNLYRAAVAAWSDAISAVALDDYGSGVIAMYENTTPPSGWSLCDGTGGTPDLRDYFLRPTLFASAGSKSGDGNPTWVSAAASHANHEHHDSNDDGGAGGTAYHQAVVQMAAHAANAGTETGWMPPYYALAFIMYDG
jgi:hypothetical protein